jgi:hypothetical protein
MKFHFAPQPDFFGGYYQPEPVDVPDRPVKREPPPPEFHFQLDKPVVKAADEFKDAFTNFGFDAAGRFRKLAPTELRKSASGDDHHDPADCSCEGSCDDCAKATAKLYFKPGTQVRHKRTGEIWTMVSTTCIGPTECESVMKRKKDGKETMCVFYQNELEQVA